MMSYVCNHRDRADVSPLSEPCLTTPVQQGVCLHGNACFKLTAAKGRISRGCKGESDSSKFLVARKFSPRADPSVKNGSRPPSEKSVLKGQEALPPKMGVIQGSLQGFPGKGKQGGKQANLQIMCLLPKTSPPTEDWERICCWTVSL